MENQTNEEMYWCNVKLECLNLEKIHLILIK